MQHCTLCKYETLGIEEIPCSQCKYCNFLNKEDNFEPKEKVVKHYNNAYLMAILTQDRTLVFYCVNRPIKAYCDTSGHIILVGDADDNTIYQFAIGDEWRLNEDKPIDFEEAMEALSLGKTVTCSLYETYQYTCDLKDGIVDTEGNAISPQEILQGKWSI